MLNVETVEGVSRRAFAGALSSGVASNLLPSGDVVAEGGIRRWASGPYEVGGVPKAAQLSAAAILVLGLYSSVILSSSSLAAPAGVSSRSTNAEKLWLATSHRIDFELRRLSDSAPGLGPAFRDASLLAAAFPADLPMPAVWSDGSSEVVFEWSFGGKHAAITVEGDGRFGCTMRVGDRFVPSNSDGIVASGAPQDLISYLAA